MDAALKIGNLLLPQLQTTIARQRRDYDLSDEFPPELPISELTDAQRENAPVNTMKMKQTCGLVAHRSKKNKSVECTSRQIIIQGTAALREKYGDNFRSYTDAAMRVKNVKLQWSQKQDTLLGEKMTKKQIENLKIEGRVLKKLDCLKKSGGPFTTPDEVDTYLQSSASDKDKVSRLKMEVQYARDTSLSLERKNPVFNIMIKKLGESKQRQMNATEFGENIKILLSKKLTAVDNVISVARFVNSLQ